MRLEKIRNFIINELGSKSLAGCYFHDMEHSLEVERACIAISENEKDISARELELLRIAALSHDIGHIERMVDHEVLGCSFIIKTMPDFGYSSKDIALVEALILATKFPHSPKTLLENIICDADLSYLGTDDYKVQADKLKKELIELHDFELSDEVKWLKFQIEFLEKHIFFTDYANDNFKMNKKLTIEKLKNKLTLL